MTDLPIDTDPRNCPCCGTAPSPLDLLTKTRNTIGMCHGCGHARLIIPTPPTVTIRDLTPEEATLYASSPYFHAHRAKAEEEFHRRGWWG